ncbi:MAG: hypothetical protein FJX57_04315 [Alphaproteobacteria bacterium]|nr:hypothetical protein [Alphaproteobacteria bacterium]
MKIRVEGIARAVSVAGRALATLSMALMLSLLHPPAQAGIVISVADPTKTYYVGDPVEFVANMRIDSAVTSAALGFLPLPHGRHDCYNKAFVLIGVLRACENVSSNHYFGFAFLASDLVELGDPAGQTARISLEKTFSSPGIHQFEVFQFVQELNEKASFPLFSLIDRDTYRYTEFLCDIFLVTCTETTRRSDVSESLKVFDQYFLRSLSFDPGSVGASVTVLAASAPVDVPGPGSGSLLWAGALGLLGSLFLERRRQNRRTA